MPTLCSLNVSILDWIDNMACHQLFNNNNNKDNKLKEKIRLNSAANKHYPILDATNPPSIVE